MMQVRGNSLVLVDLFTRCHSAYAELGFEHLKYSIKQDNED